MQWSAQHAIFGVFWLLVTTNHEGPYRAPYLAQYRVPLDSEMRNANRADSCNSNLEIAAPGDVTKR